MNIKPEFKNLIRSLSPDEFEQLEKNCLSEGIREPLIVWNNGTDEVLIDGHHRYQIAQKHSLPFETVVKEFESEYDVIAWIINNQLGRRNLTAQEMSYLRGLEYENEKARHGGDRGNQYTKKKVESPQNEDFPLSDKTYEKLADKHGVSFKKSGLGFKPE